MQRPELFPALRLEVASLLNGYVSLPGIAPPQLGVRAGVLGAIALAEALVTARSG
jgi:fructokinase